MKLLYIIIATIINVAGCRQEVIPPANTDTYIKYKVNGSDVILYGDHASLLRSGSGVYGSKQEASQTAGFSKTRYVVLGQAGPNRVVTFTIITDSLRAQSYLSADSASRGVSYVKQDENAYLTNIGVNDRFQINISRYSEGSIDGSFSGTGVNVKTVNGVTTYQQGVITEGLFQKVRINY